MAEMEKTFNDKLVEKDKLIKQLTEESRAKDIKC